MSKSLENYLVKSSLFKHQNKFYPHYISYRESGNHNQDHFTTKKEKPSEFYRNYTHQLERAQPYTYPYCEICNSRSKSRSKSKLKEQSKLTQRNSRYEHVASRDQSQKKSRLIRNVIVQKEPEEPISDDKFIVAGNNSEIKMKSSRREKPSYFSRNYIHREEQQQPYDQNCEICRSHSKSHSKSKILDQQRLEQQNSYHRMERDLSSKKSGLIRNVNIEKQPEEPVYEEKPIVTNNNEIKMTNFSSPSYYQPKTYTLKSETSYQSPSQSPPPPPQSPSPSPLSLNRGFSNQDKFAQTQSRVMVNSGIQIKIQQAIPQRAEILKKSKVEQPKSTFKHLKTIQVQIQPSLNVQQQYQPRAEINQEQKKLFFNSTRHQTTKYLQNIHLQLRSTYRQLQKKQKQIDGIIEINLQKLCQKLQQNLYRIIEIQLQEFKIKERKNFYQNKVAYMSQLYEIKTNIGYRIQDIDDFKIKLKDEYGWKEVIGNLLTPDYQSNIQFIIKKAQQVKVNSINHTNHFLTNYSQTMIETVHQPLQKQIAFALQSLLCNFSGFWKKMIQRIVKTKKQHNFITHTYYSDQPKIEISRTVT